MVIHLVSMFQHESVMANNEIHSDDSLCEHLKEVKNPYCQHKYLVSFQIPLLNLYLSH